MSSAQSKTTFNSLTDSQYRFIIWVIIFSLTVAAAPAAAGFYIIGELGGSPATVSYGVSFFVLGELLTKPHGIIIGTRIGRVRLLKICLSLYILFSIPLFVIESYWSYLFFRFLTGVVAGPIFLIGTSLAGSIGPKRERKYMPFIFVMINLLVTIPVIAAAMGAIVAYQYDWKFIYMILMVIPVCLLMTAPVLFKNQEAPVDQKPIDWVGIYTFAAGLFGLGFCLITGQEIDGFRSLLFNLTLFFGALHFVFFLFWNTWHPHPILNFSFFKSLPYLLNSIYTFVLYNFFFAIIVLLSIWLHLYVFYSMNWIAISLVAILIAPLILVIIYRWHENPKSIFFVFLGLFLLSMTSFYISTYNVDVNFGRIIITKLVAGISIVLALPYVISQLILACRCKEEIPYAFGLWAIVRVGASFTGSAYFTTLWSRRLEFFHSRLGGELTPFSQNTKGVLETLNFFHFKPLMKLEGLNDTLNRQSAALALNDCFFVIGWVLLIVALMAFFHTIIVLRRAAKA